VIFGAIESETIFTRKNFFVHLFPLDLFLQQSIVSVFILSWCQSYFSFFNSTEKNLFSSKRTCASKSA